MSERMREGENKKEKTKKGETRKFGTQSSSFEFRLVNSSDVLEARPHEFRRTFGETWRSNARE